MTWKEHQPGEFFFSFEEGPHAGQVLVNVFPERTPPHRTHVENPAWRWEAHLPEGYQDWDMDGWWGRAPTREGAQEAAEAYLRRHGVLLT